MLKRLGTIFKNAIDQLGVFDYARDAKIVKKYLGVDLTREQFDRYRHRFLLSEVLNDGMLNGIRSASLGKRNLNDALIIANILNILDSADVTLDTSNNDFRERLKNAINTHVAQYFEMPDIPNVYKNNADINAHISRINKQYPYLDPSVSMPV